MGERRRPSILVVDDEPEIRRLVESALAPAGFDVELASDGMEALSRLEADRHDAIVLDVVMPRLDGIELCHRLRAAGKRLPILVVTAGGAAATRALAAGADDVLEKPFGLDELQRRVRGLL